MTDPLLDEAVVHDGRWFAVLARAERDDFVYAVRSTRVYCRPSCPSRRPRRDNVTFFERGADAEAHGYRACRRCRPDAPRTDARVARVEAACRLLADGDATRMADVAAALQVTTDALRRDFQRVLGVSPKQYAGAQRVDRLRTELRDGRDVTAALYRAGYGSSSRLYEQADARLGMTPASYGARGAGASIRYTVVPSALGMLLVARTARGICRIALDVEAAALEHQLRHEFAAAQVVRDDAALAPAVEEVLRRVDGRLPRAELPLDVRGTAFQLRVWQELQRIPRGETRSYGEVAATVGVPRGARAVGAACGSNPVAVVVPCHRVVTAAGDLRGYAWGLHVKEQLLARERARQSTSRTRPVSTS